ncbi:MAG TPA: hypothetical protein DDY20_06615 [Desulfobulbaceae bacterium]|nr:hypothetical protein [Desulfobulbaceae bacterium]
MSTEIATFGTLFRIAWDQYKKRAMPLLAVLLISAVAIGSLAIALVLCATLGGAMLTHFTDERTATYLVIVMVCVLLLVLIALFLWSQTALLAMVANEDIGIIEAFQAGWTWLWPMAWVLTLFSAVVLGGFALGILPGFLFLAWFAFCMFVLLEEDRRGMDALLASKEYVRGHWWNTFGKLLVLWLISAVAGFIPLIGQVFSLLLTPFFMLFLLAMFRDLKAVKGEAEIDASPGCRVFWWFMAVIGLALPLAVLAAAFFSLLTGGQEWMHIPDSMHGRWL